MVKPHARHPFRNVAMYAAFGLLTAMLLLSPTGFGAADGLFGLPVHAFRFHNEPFPFAATGISFFIILLFYGRSELALISTVALAAAWIALYTFTNQWGPGSSHFLLFETPLIAGLGTGFNLFLIQSLVSSFKTGEPAPPPLSSMLFYVLLSVLALISLLWAAGHPFTGTGTSWSVGGILLTLALSGILVPRLFRAMVYDRKKRRVEPVTLTSFLVSVIAFTMFLAGSLLLTLIIPVLKIIPIGRDRAGAFFHLLIATTLRIVVYSIFPIRKVIEVRNKLDFSKPSVIVCNHQSHLDLSIILMLHPKIIVLTNKWVWNNPFYGFVVRYAGFYPIFKGVDQHLADRLREKADQGYSILVFPEGTRTNDGRINRFHQGAFWLADRLKIDIQPLLLHGANHCMIKSEFFLRPGTITLRALESVKVDSVGDDESYRMQAQALCKLYRREFEKMSMELETPHYFRNRLLSQFKYMGPVVEWYARVKTKLEKNYNRFNSLIPREASVVDIGCGYGFLSQMLGMVSEKRRVLGLDYDGEKIAVAVQTGASLKNVRFEVADMLHYDLPKADVFILLDVLHYLPPGFQEPLMTQCIRQLNPGGLIIIRDADTDLEKRMWRTRLNEFCSTRFFRFNKTRVEALSYISGTMIADIAARHGFMVERDDHSTKKADITFILKQPVQ